MSASMENTNDQLQLIQHQKSNYIEETILKKRKSSEDWANRRRQQLLDRKWQHKQDKKLDFKRPEHFIHEYRSKELDLVQMKYRSKKRKADTVRPGSKLLFAIRLNNKIDIHPKVKKTLESLGLRRAFTGVFLRATQGTLEMLQKVEPYVTYGYPNSKNVSELIHKKARLKVGNQKFPLTDNNVIEQNLEKYGILCIEDIVHEIQNVGPNFKAVVASLWPVILDEPERDVLQGLKNPFRKGGDSGNREDLINELIDKMN